MSKRYYFFSDDHNGWLQVEKSEIPKGNGFFFTNKSRQDDSYYYLDEDVDAKNFLNLLDEQVEIIDLPPSESEHPIRNYPKI